MARSAPPTSPGIGWPSVDTGMGPPVRCRGTLQPASMPRCRLFVARKSLTPTRRLDTSAPRRSVAPTTKRRLNTPGTVSSRGEPSVGLKHDHMRSFVVDPCPADASKPGRSVRLGDPHWSTRVAFLPAGRRSTIPLGEPPRRPVADGPLPDGRELNVVHEPVEQSPKVLMVSRRCGSNVMVLMRHDPLRLDDRIPVLRGNRNSDRK